MKTKIDLKSTFAFITFFVGFGSFMQAQEHLSPGRVNFQLKPELHQQKDSEMPSVYSVDSIPGDTGDVPRPPTIKPLSLPFFDDFSFTEGVLPNDSLWLDDEVYISNTYAVDPPSIGVAVFDGLDRRGNPYLEIGRPQAPIGCDTLTSNYINLSNYSTEDSLYLYFELQPQGRGDEPQEQDAFIVQFRADSAFFIVGDTSFWDRDVWRTIAEIPGSSVTPFQKIILPIQPDSSNLSVKYHYDSFQFRFINLGNGSGNLDHWMLDYVYLDEIEDTSAINFNDIAIVEPGLGLMSEYTSMPWNHFLEKRRDALRDDITFRVRNNGLQTVQSTYGYRVNNLNNNASFNQTGASSDDILPQEFTTYPPIQNVFPQRFNEMIFEEGTGTNVPVLESPVRIDLVYEENTVNDRFPSNNRFTYKHIFANYFAYDDGSLEQGYSIKNVRSRSGAAQRFTAYTTDTLRSVAIAFNRGRVDVSQRPFDLVVWKSIPDFGEYVLEDDEHVRIEALSPQFTHANGGFHIYELDTAIIIEKGETFYVGFQQFGEFLINIGYDDNYAQFRGSEEPNPNLVYFYDGTWKRSTMNGALMIRPIFGWNMPITSTEVLPEEIDFLLFPNPTSDFIQLSTSYQEELSYEIFQLNGQKMTQGRFRQQQQLSVENYRPGLYLIRIMDAASGKVSTEKFIVH